MSCEEVIEHTMEASEASHVLANYLDLIQSNSNQLKFQLARNSVLDWFGRSVCGPVKIHQYLQNEISFQYEHVDFQKAKDCDPIECRPTHQKTKQLATGEVDYKNPMNKVTGITSLKPYADSDLEDEDMNTSPLPAGHKTPERMDNIIIAALTPPASRTKQDFDSASGTDDDEEEEEFMKAKRLKRTHPSSPFSYLRRLPTTAAKAMKRKSYQSSDTRTLLDDTSSEEEDEAMPPATYNQLCYLEATGVLCGKVREHQQQAGPATCGVGDTNRWNRPIRMRISYRKRLDDGQPQYALVIYEHLERADRVLARCNLMSVFSQAAEQHDEEAADIDAPIDIVEVQPALVVHPTPTDGETVVTTVATPTTEEIAAALETAAFTIVPLRTPTKVSHTPPPTPKRKPRLPHAMSGLKRLNLSPSSSASSSTPKRNAARSLRL